MVIVQNEHIFWGLLVLYIDSIIHSLLNIASTSSEASDEPVPFGTLSTNPKIEPSRSDWGKCICKACWSHTHNMEVDEGYQI